MLRTFLLLNFFVYFTIGAFGVQASTDESASPPSPPLCGTPNSCVFLEPPEGFSSQMEVAGCFCEYQGKLLLLLRSPQKPQGNTWCVPGGKLEKGEAPLHAVIREVEEETGIQLREEAVNYCRKVYIRFPGRDFVLHIFRARLKNLPERLKIAPEEHSSYRWVTLEQARDMPLIPGGSDCLRLAFTK